MSLRARVEIKIVLTIEKSQPLRLIVHAVGMDDVHHYRYSHPVGGIDQFLELVGGPEPGTQGEKVGNLIAE